MKTIKQFAKDVIQRFQHDWEGENLEFVLKHFKKLESRHLGDRDSLILEVKDFTNDFENDIYNRLHWLYFKMFPETTTKEIEDYKPNVKQVYKEFIDHEYRQLVFNTAECIYLHKVKQVRDKIILGEGSNSNTNTSRSEASNTGIGASIPQIGETLSKLFPDINLEDFKSLERKEVMLLCILQGVSEQNAIDLLKYQYKLKNKELTSGPQMRSVYEDYVDKDFRTCQTTDTKTRRIVGYQKKRYENVVPMLTEDNKEDAEKELEIIKETRLEANNKLNLKKHNRL